MRRDKVFIPNKSNHDFSTCDEFGEAIYITEGVISRLAVNQMEALAHAAMREAEPGDFVMISSLPVLVAIMTGIMAARFNKVNFLLWRHGRYLKKVVEF